MEPENPPTLSYGESRLFKDGRARIWRALIVWLSLVSMFVSVFWQQMRWEDRGRNAHVIASDRGVFHQYIRLAMYDVCRDRSWIWLWILPAQATCLIFVAWLSERRRGRMLPILELVFVIMGGWIAPVISQIVFFDWYFLRTFHR